MDTLPDEQCAWVVQHQGPPRKALCLKTDWPVPKTLVKGEVLVKVQAAALNPAGWKLMALPDLVYRRPHVAEFDLAGVIVDGNGSQFSAGDPVYGWVPSGIQRKTGQGALTQYVRMPASDLVIRPSNISPVEAAGVTIAAMTSYQAIYSIAQVQPGHTVFVNGGSSACGAFAIQFAKAKGARVVATASGRNEDFVRKMGADQFVDYTKAPLHRYLSEHKPDPKYHVIYDAVGLVDPSLFVNSEKYLAPDGLFISTGPMPKNISIPEIWKLLRTFGAVWAPSLLGGVNRRYVWISMDNNNQDMIAIQKLLADGAIKPIVDSTYQFEDALKAYDRIMSSRAVGKIVVKVDRTL
ncbi:hypothetical protein B0H34DRAFT_299067 [Crassisporium funariophilum]|nr:hypothetical protein B0H34DRAFT_299067 [Crassisporium funariophilum]